MARMVALLRAVNIGGRKLPMAELRTLCEELGWREVATYIQSGNIVFTAKGRPPAIEAELERAIAAKFGLAVPVIVRSAAEWLELAAANPFATVARDEPTRFQLLVSKRPPKEDAADKLMARALAGERVEAAGGALWLHFPAGVGASKLTPVLIDKSCGSPSTSRNWRTVMKLKEMLEA